MESGPSFPATRFDHPHVKVCGLKRVHDALEASTLGASFLGVVLSPKSRRQATHEEARGISRAIRELTRRPLLAGVFVDEPAEEIVSLLESIPLDYVQIHGPVERIVGLIGGSRVVPAYAVRDESSVDAALAENHGNPAIVLDTHRAGEVGGTGRLFDHQLALHAIARRRVFLAGGLSPETIPIVERQLRTAHALPYAYDMSSGIESAPGEKDHARMRLFFQNLRDAAKG